VLASLHYQTQDLVILKSPDRRESNLPATILVINGPNLNNLGKRDSSLYGTKTLVDIQDDITAKATKLGVDVIFFQSNHEGAIVDHIQEVSAHTDGVIINAGALTQVGYSILDALLDSGLPFIEVHLSNIHARERFRQRSVFASKAIGQMAGFGPSGYIYALDHLSSVVKS
jgi:3-dehydroquinate dehydratase-2